MIRGAVKDQRLPNFWKKSAAALAAGFSIAGAGGQWGCVRSVGGDSCIVVVVVVVLVHDSFSSLDLVDVVEEVVVSLVVVVIVC